jgi:hypothetical protein
MTMLSKLKARIFVTVLLLVLMAAWYVSLGLSRLLIVDRAIFELPNKVGSGLSEPWTDDLEVPGLKVRSSRKDFALYSVTFQQRLATDGNTVNVVPASVQFRLRYWRVVPAMSVSLVLWFVVSCVIVGRFHWWHAKKQGP